MKISFLFVGQTLVSVAAVIVALYILDLKYLIENLQLISTIGIFTALVLNLLSIYLMAWRWFWIEQGAKLNGSSNSVFTYFVASIYNLISPGNLGGDIYRFIALKSESLTPLVLTGKIFRERLAGLGSICLVGFVDSLLCQNCPRFCNIAVLFGIIILRLCHFYIGIRLVRLLLEGFDSGDIIFLVW